MDLTSIDISNYANLNLTVNHLIKFSVIVDRNAMIHKGTLLAYKTRK